ncbi:transmembrane protein 258-like [Phacochoerus africanus]|uniref:transmembrane protein 258-like n=1 Tax=Phacochoerus africanus TaxID=41426 RepID=UPI001FD9002F|nr:transmembrane protein 258-like [Phacochoerus africanus]
MAAKELMKEEAGAAGSRGELIRVEVAAVQEARAHLKSCPGAADPVPAKAELEAMSRYASLMIPAVCPHLTVLLSAIGIFTALSSVYDVTSTKDTQDICVELLTSLVVSLLPGFGVLFLLFWVGLYM